MQETYIRHNYFVRGLEEYKERDPHLTTLRELKFVHPLDWWRELDWNTPGIYILTGGRQIGKSTSTKLLILHALEKKLFHPSQIFYLPCDQINTHDHLAKIVSSYANNLPPGSDGRFLVVIDEITYVAGWDRAIKALADDGTLGKAFCILTGSDSVVLKEAASRFPGRRGRADKPDFQIYPLSFREFVRLVEEPILKDPERQTGRLFDCFDNYLKCGGYLKAINDLYQQGEIRKATYLTFEQWLRGDFERRGKNSDTLMHVLKTVFETSGTQVTYSSLAHKMGQTSKETFIDYVNMLERMGIIVVLQAFDQNTRLGFPKKARKIHFADPFIMDTVALCLESERLLEKNDTPPLKAESVVASNYCRRLPTYYWKGDGEIDVIAVTGKRFQPIEVKWTSQVRTQDLKELKKHKNSIVLTKSQGKGHVEGISSVPLPLHLVTCFPFERVTK